MNVLLTGANGFVGSAIARACTAHGHDVVALVREDSNANSVGSRCKVVRGDFTDYKAMRALLEVLRPAAIVHAAAVVSSGRSDAERAYAVNVEGTASLLAAAEATGVTRWIQISSMSAHAGNKSAYGGSKYLADQAVIASKLRWTILRPSVVYGPSKRGIFAKLQALVSRLPAIPIVGTGREPIRPVHVDDVAAAVVAALGTEVAVGRSYQLAGPEPWCFRDVVRAVAGSQSRPVILLPVPVPICRLVAVVGEQLLASPPLTLDNVEGICRAEPIDTGPAISDLGFAPRPFDLAEAAPPSAPPPDRKPRRLRTRGA